MRKGQTFYRGDARVTVLSGHGWHAVTVCDSSGSMFGYEVASYRALKVARAHAKMIRDCFRVLTATSHEPAPGWHRKANGDIVRDRPRAGSKGGA